jgi:hypothetical protein
LNSTTPRQWPAGARGGARPPSRTPGGPAAAAAPSAAAPGSRGSSGRPGQAPDLPNFSLKALGLTVGSSWRGSRRRRPRTAPQRALALGRSRGGPRPPLRPSARVGRLAVHAPSPRAAAGGASCSRAPPIKVGPPSGARMQPARPSAGRALAGSAAALARGGPRAGGVCPGDQREQRPTSAGLVQVRVEARLLGAAGPRPGRIR